ncbi:hypothetical protein ACTV1I_000663 [Cronobacter dublinensis]
MSGGYWGKGNNPFFNYDFDAASQDREKHRLQAEAHRDKLDSEMQIFSLRLQMDSLRSQMDSNSRRMKSAVAHQENLRDEMKTGCFKLALRSNILQRTLSSLMDNHPQIKELILEEIKKQHTHCYSESYRQTWWKWANEFKNNPNHYDAYFTFPFPMDEEPKE